MVYTALVRDITERQRAEQQVQRYLEELTNEREALEQAQGSLEEKVAESVRMRRATLNLLQDHQDMREEAEKAQSQVNRFMALRSDAAVRTARRISLTWAVLVYGGMILVGLCARAILGNPEDIGEPGAPYDKEQAFFDVALATLPSVAAGIMLAAVLSAIMSTADSQLLVAAATVSHDMGLRGKTAKNRLLGDRLVILGLSAVAILAAIYGSREIFTKVLYAWTSMGAAFGPLLFWILFRGRVPAAAALTSMLVGFSSAVWFYYQPLGWQGFEKYIVPYVLSSLALVLMARQR